MGSPYREPGNPNPTWFFFPSGGVVRLSEIIYICNFESRAKEILSWTVRLKGGEGIFITPNEAELLLKALKALHE